MGGVYLPPPVKSLGKRPEITKTTWLPPASIIAFPAPFPHYVLQLLSLGFSPAFRKCLAITSWKEAYTLNILFNSIDVHTCASMCKPYSLYICMSETFTVLYLHSLPDSYIAPGPWQLTYSTEQHGWVVITMHTNMMLGFRRIIYWPNVSWPVKYTHALKRHNC